MFWLFFEDDALTGELQGGVLYHPAWAERCWFYGVGEDELGEGLNALLWHHTHYSLPI